MSTYAIGDLQGCLDPLLELLARLEFDRRRDCLWLTGDLVNRGPQSLACLRFVKELGPAAVTVLGNHDLHLLAHAAGHAPSHRSDTFDDVLDAPDRDELLHWLRHQPLLHHDAALGFTMVHAGLAPQWDLATAQQCAREVEQCLRGPDHMTFYKHMYGNQPKQWSPALSGWDRLRFITNCFTRLRYCDADGRLNLKAKGEPGSQAPPYEPWFRVAGRANADLRIVFGHWSTLGAQAEAHQDAQVYALDTGCVWGGALTALRLPDLQRVHVACTQQQAIHQK